LVRLGNIKACIFTHFDGSTTPALIGQQASLTQGLATQVDRYSTTCTATGGTGIITSKAQYNTNGDPINGTDADAVAGITGHTATTGSFPEGQIQAILVTVGVQPA